VKVDELTGKSPACALVLVAADPVDVESCRASIMRVGIAIFMIASISPIARGLTSATGILGPNLTISLERVDAIMAEARASLKMVTLKNAGCCWGWVVKFRGRCDGFRGKYEAV
jgi:hypothetical protein